MEPYPISSEIYNKLNFHTVTNSNAETFFKLHTTDWEEEVFISENFTLYKTQKKIQNFISEKKFDIIYFDAFSPEKQTEMWTTEVFEKCFDLINKDGFLITYCAKGIFRRTLKSVGFEVISLDGPPGKRQMTRANKSTYQK